MIYRSLRISVHSYALSHVAGYIKFKLGIITLEVVEGPRGRVCVDLAHVGAGVVDGDAADGEDEHVAALVVDHADPLVRRHPRRPGRQELLKM